MQVDPAPRSRAPLREIFGWCMFDFANSSFTTIIVTVVFSVYFTGIVCSDPETGKVRPDADFLWGLATMLSQGLVLLTAPLMGALADFSGAKKKFLMTTWLSCCACTALLALVKPGDVWMGVWLFVFANIAYSAGENFNASFLPELADAENMGKISGYGWALGYFGGLFALLVCYPFVSQGMTIANADNLRLTSLLTAAFFFCAGIPTFILVRERGIARVLPAGATYLSIGFERLRVTLSQVGRFRELVKFLFVFSVYNMGLCSIVNFASIYASKELQFDGTEVLQLFLILQITAAIGAFALGYFQDRFGAKAALTLSLIIWLFVSVGGWMARTKSAFFVVGNLAGLALGSSQSGARALIALLSPASRSAEFFGFWGLFWKLSAALGPLAFGWMSSNWSGRTAVLANGVFFAVGLAGLAFVDVERGREVALEADAIDRKAAVAS